VKVKFNAQKGYEWMMVTFSKVVLYGSDTVSSGQFIVHK